MINWEMIVAISAVSTVVGAVFLWTVSVILEPIKQLIKENTKAVEKLVDKMDSHEERIQIVEKEVAILKDREERV